MSVLEALNLQSALQGTPLQNVAFLLSNIYFPSEAFVAPADMSILLFQLPAPVPVLIDFYTESMPYGTV
jgi:hypothetical protein